MSTGQFLAGGTQPGAPPGGGAVENSNFLPGWYEDYMQRTNAAALAQASTGYTPYGGPRLASTSDPTQQVRQRVQDRFTNPIYGGALNAASANLTAAGSPLTDAAVKQYMNPYTSNVVDDLTRRMTSNFTDKVLPGIGIGYVGAGQSGSERELLSNRQAASDFEQNLGGAVGSALNTGYTGALSQFNADRNAQLNAGGALQGLAGTQFGLDTAATGQMAGVGSDIEGREQQGLDLGYQNFQQQRDWNPNQISWLNNILHGQNVPTSSASFSSPTTMPSGTLQMLAGSGAVANQLGQMAPPAYARGGRVIRRPVRRYAMGGTVFPDIVRPGGGLGHMGGALGGVFGDPRAMMFRGQRPNARGRGSVRGALSMLGG